MRDGELFQILCWRHPFRASLGYGVVNALPFLAIAALASARSNDSSTHFAGSAFMFGAVWGTLTVFAKLAELRRADPIRRRVELALLALVAFVAVLIASRPHDVGEVGGILLGAVLCGAPFLVVLHWMQASTRRRTDRLWEAKHGPVAWYVPDAPPLPEWVPRLGLRRG